MALFVHEKSIVREIWGKADTVLFIFAGAAAEFALNKAVDWLFFTGRLPADPIGRLFSTVTYAQKIVFSSQEQANNVIDQMSAIHGTVEAKRGMAIPAWAYRDVLYMLIDYSIRAYELLNRPLSTDEKEEVYDVFKRVGLRMNIKDLPDGYNNWVNSRVNHMDADLQPSDFTTKLFESYRKHLGFFRYQILLGSQSLVVPSKVAALLKMKRSMSMLAVVNFYKLLKVAPLQWYLKKLILPKQYVRQIKNLDLIQ